MPPETQTTEQPTTQTTQTTESQDQSSQNTSQQTEQADSQSSSQGTSLLNEEGDKKPEQKPAGAPEKYEPFTAPASWADKGLELDPKTIEAAGAVFKDLGLTQEQGQKLVDFYTGIAEASSDAAMNAVADMRKGWRDLVSADKNLGHRLPEVKANFSKMLGSLGDANLVSAFKEAMDLTGAGDHPAFIRAMDLWSQRFVEGTHVQGNGPSPAGQTAHGSRPESAARALYPNNP